MKQSDAAEFSKATIKEFDYNCQNKHWKIVERSQVPMNKNILPAVWAMRRRRDLITREIIEYKARFNVHGGKHIPH